MKRMRRLAIMVLGFGCLLAVPGCPGRVKPPTMEEPPRPPRMMREIVETIDANARLLTQALWSNSVSVTAYYTDKDGKRHTYNLDGSFLFQRPQNLRMDLRPSMGDQVMQIGSNTDEYWFWLDPEVRTMWWGKYRYLGRPCAHTIDIQPDQLVAALGLGGLPRTGHELIGPARKYGKDFDILYYLRERPATTTAESDEAALQIGGRYLLVQEYWVDRSPPYLVRGVVFLDELGRTATSAILDDYRAAWAGGPFVAHKVQIDWPLRKGNFKMSVSGFTAKPLDKVSKNAFERPTEGRLPPSIQKVEQVDTDCEEGGSAETTRSLSEPAVPPTSSSAELRRPPRAIRAATVRERWGRLEWEPLPHGRGSDLECAITMVAPQPLPAPLLMKPAPSAAMPSRPGEGANVQGPSDGAALN